MSDRQFPISLPCPHCGAVSECAGGICQNAKCPGKTSVERFGYELLRALEMVSGSPDGANATFDLVAMWKPGAKLSLIEDQSGCSSVSSLIVYVSARDLARDVLVELEVREQKAATEKAKLVAEIHRLRIVLDRLTRISRLDNILDA